MNLVTSTRALLLTALLTGATPTFAKDTNYMTLSTQYATAVEERGDAVKRALGSAEAMLKSNASDAVALAYKGSLLTMVGGDALMPWNKLKYVNVGLELLDEAVASSTGAPSHGLDPELEILMVAGFTNARLPAMFKREPLARQIISRLLEHPRFDDLAPELRAQALSIAAAYANKDGNGESAKILLERAKTANAKVAQSVFDERS
ncbi:hypothetical protein OS190_13290 [Sulfitobacter sp. F26204]|uniref:hypothetical protein n=1 Tax=Sulfitobacter sp. F26204 TaxID=2996014 RepID=UPI00225E42DD|nr:hypothetical protein [Sulfitobacter sp. F26204]MCX7560545.1 hypothetical protein [Sulfitobacter sp. F26204]